METKTVAMDSRNAVKEAQMKKTILAIALCGIGAWMQLGTEAQTRDVFAVNRTLARTINFGNALEAPYEGAWGLRLEEEFFDVAKRGGFTAIRLPAKFSAHADEKAPYKIKREFLLRLDWAIQNAKKRGLSIIIDLHHYDELFKDPPAHLERFLGIWQQLAERYKNQPDTVLFEPCNEPHEKLEPYWNDYLAKVVALIRQTNPTRALVVGGNGWNNAERLGELRLPEDPNLIVTFHNYTPFPFTHQGAEWWEDGAKHLGTTWKGTPDEQKVVIDHIAKAVNFAAEHNKPLFMGEFGAYSKADLASRVRWTSFTRKTLEAARASWGYWEFASGFGVYDKILEQYRKPLLDALMK
jgi:endoglucanase